MFRVESLLHILHIQRSVDNNFFDLTLDNMIALLYMLTATLRTIQIVQLVCFHGMGKNCCELQICTLCAEQGMHFKHTEMLTEFEALSHDIIFRYLDYKLSKSKFAKGNNLKTKR